MNEFAAQSVTAFSLGLLGSGHCLAMCGGIMGALSMRATHASAVPVPVAVGTAPRRQFSRSMLISHLLLYSTGRLLSYAALGLAFGLLGALLVSAVEPARLVLRGVAGALLIAMGLYVAGIWNGIVVLERLGGSLWQRVGAGIRTGRGGTLLLGVTWGLLPCGLVYGTLAWAASAAEPLRSGWLMLAFGLGTLPMVLAGSYFSSSLLAPLRRPGLRLAAGVLVAGFGIWTLLGAGDLHGNHADGHDHGHGHVGAVTRTEWPATRPANGDHAVAPSDSRPGEIKG